MSHPGNPVNPRAPAPPRNDTFLTSCRAAPIFPPPPHMLEFPPFLCPPKNPTFRGPRGGPGGPPPKTPLLTPPKKGVKIRANCPFLWGFLPGNPKSEQIYLFIKIAARATGLFLGLFGAPRGLFWGVCGGVEKPPFLALFRGGAQNPLFQPACEMSPKRISSRSHEFH